jgi:hypothetical protein
VHSTSVGIERHSCLSTLTEDFLGEYLFNIDKMFIGFQVPFSLTVLRLHAINS